MYIPLPFALTANDPPRTSDRAVAPRRVDSRKLALSEGPAGGLDFRGDDAGSRGGSGRVVMELLSVILYVVVTIGQLIVNLANVPPAPLPPQEPVAQVERLPVDEDW
jgi:hypothetical protein